jgi:hypothetical protein
MKGLVSFLILLFLHACATAQSNIRDWDRSTIPSRTIYYIDGINLDSADAGVGIRCYFPIPVVWTAGVIVFDCKQLNRLPQRNVNAVAGIVAGVDSRAGQIPNIRGARPEGTAYYIDGIRVRSTELAIE